jgi:hypothetical protein
MQQVASALRRSLGDATDVDLLLLSEATTAYYRCAERTHGCEEGREGIQGGLQGLIPSSVVVVGQWHGAGFRGGASCDAHSLPLPLSHLSLISSSPFL